MQRMFLASLTQREIVSACTIHSLSHRQLVFSLFIYTYAQHMHGNITYALSLSLAIVCLSCSDTHCASTSLRVSQINIRIEDCSLYHILENDVRKKVIRGTQSGKEKKNERKKKKRGERERVLILETLRFFGGYGGRRRPNASRDPSKNLAPANPQCRSTEDVVNRQQFVVVSFLPDTHFCGEREAASLA